jgi:hypothetical protein
MKPWYILLLILLSCGHAPKKNPYQLVVGNSWRAEVKGAQDQGHCPYHYVYELKIAAITKGHFYEYQTMQDLSPKRPVTCTPKKTSAPKIFYRPQSYFDLYPEMNLVALGIDSEFSLQSLGKILFCIEAERPSGDTQDICTMKQVTDFYL